MSSPSVLSSKHDIMKAHSFNFLENEKTHWDIIHQHENTGHNISTEEQNNYQFINETILKCNSSRTDAPQEKPLEPYKTTEFREDNSGSSKKKYVTECFFEPKSVPYWYSESLVIHLDSVGKFEHDEKVFYQDKLRPIRWCEMVTIELPKKNFNEFCFCIDEEI